VPFRINEQFDYGYSPLSPLTGVIDTKGANKGKVVNLILGLPFSEKTCSEVNRRKFLFIPSKFRLFGGTKNARNSIPSQSTEGLKSLEVHLNKFEEEKITQNFVISLGTILMKVKMLVIPFRTIS
jgi:hypothetical protein